ncbi:hypothetical protein A3L08_08255 [Thermococcus pacificus]|uniref:Uncharacterized protein n=2 Tax=Thermococcus pacificus TaxID=71998 RepID=A0A218P967_9EURY|nr:hypothetical protein A3L08_08255 [Thermococcus pacificus]
MNIYFTTMAAGGMLVLLGIFLTWNLARVVEKFRTGKKRLSWLVLLGGLLTAMGFIPAVAMADSSVIVWAVILGPVLISYALSESGLVRANLEMLLQVGVVIASLVLQSGDYIAIAESFSAVSIILLINAVAFYIHTPPGISRTSKAAAWLFAIFVLLNAWGRGNPYVLSIYILSMFLWISALVRLHFIARDRFYRNAQEDL